MYILTDYLFRYVLSLMFPTSTIAPLFDLLQFASPAPWVRPTSSGRAAASPASDFLTPDGHLVPRAIGEAALRESRAILIGDLLVMGTLEASSSRSSW